MSSMTKDEINTSLFDEVQRQREEIERLEAENARLERHISGLLIQNGEMAAEIERLESERVKLLMGACAKLRQACEILDQIEKELDQELKKKSDE